MYRLHYPDDPGMHHDPGRYTRTSYRTNQSFCARVRQSLVAVIVGCILLCAAAGLLFWNEGRAVQRSKALKEGLNNVLSLPSIDVAFEEYNGKLVYLSGALRTSELLRDDLYSEVKVHAVKLRRTVLMYQWVEHQSVKDVREGEFTRSETSYSYSQEWQPEQIDSNSFNNKFNHLNPGNELVGVNVIKAKDVYIGNFLLSEVLVERIKDFKPLSVSLSETDHNVKLIKDGLYIGNNPNDPQTGDVKIHYEYAGLSDDGSSGEAPAMVSVIAKQEGTNLLPYHTEMGEQLEFLYTGKLTPQQIFGNEMAHNAFLTWALRLAGWLIMFVGFGCLTRIFITLVDWIPVVRELMIMGTMTLNAVLAISLSLIVVALGWITYRPLLGICILLCSLAPFLYSKIRSRNRSD